MDKNELCKKVSAGMLLVTMSLYATPVFAYSKDETVYSKLNSEGNSYKTIVSTHLKNTDSENTLNDMTNLTNIKNTNGDEKFSQNGNSLIWDAQKHDIYYQGESENELPISCSVKYELDGEEISAKDIAGKSGKVKVTINYENKSENLVNINGKTQKLYTPFVVVAGTMINNKNNRKMSGGEAMKTFDRVAKILENLSGSDMICPESSLIEDLALDSLKMVVLLIELEEEFGIELEASDLDPFALSTAEDIANLAEKYLSGEQEVQNE